MNSGTGITLGVLYGATLFVTFCLATLQLGYWGIQLRNGGDNSPLVKVFGKSYEWLQGSGLVKTVRGLDPLPIYYYNVADCVGLLYQNPSASRRLEQHPESMILAEMPQFQSIAKNDSFKNTFRGKPNIDELLKHDASYNAFIDRNLPNTLSTVDWVDVYGFLATGKSEKWGNHSLMGRWEVSILDTVVAASKKVNPSDENAVVKLKFLQKAMGLMVSDLELLVNANDEVHLKGSIESAADLKGLVSGRPSRQLITKVLKRIQSGAKAAQPKPQAPQENEFGEVMMDDPDAVGGEAPAGGGGGASGGNMLESGELHGSSSPFTANWSDGTQGRMTVEGNLVRVEYGGGVIVFERVE